MSEHRTLLIELGCEELPARLIAEQAEALRAGVVRRLAQAGLSDPAETGTWLATPRRLALKVPGVATRQPDRVLERKGPAEAQAFDDQGNPTRAAEGFARSVGRSVEELERIEEGGQRRLYARIEQPGRSLAELLPEILAETVREMAGARSMRWSDRPERFLRPVRWLVVLHGSQIVPLELFGLAAGRTTLGHRVHARGPHEIAGVDDYDKVLKGARVLVDPQARRARIARQLERLAEAEGLIVDPDPELLDEVVGLTEWPVAVTGGFDPAFLEVPAEALIASMQQHQKCFPLRRSDGPLANRFIAVANLESADSQAMITGFERVIRPRLADAQFFWDTDRRQPLAARLERLDEIRFAEGLGSLGDKVRRLETLAPALARELGADPEATARAARLCKCDLVTEMVGEFPELQGIMGRHYAAADGEDKAVARAIESHYRPRQAADELPADDPGRALALADRLDTLVGVFACGQKPSGGKDPFALRRAALAVVRILEASETGLELQRALEMTARGLKNQVAAGAAVCEEVEEFILERLRSHAAESGIETNTFHAVEAAGLGSVADFLRRARAVQAFADDPEAASLIAANKRTQNLLRQAGENTISDVDDNLLQEDEEVRLFEELLAAEKDLQGHLAAHDYPGALSRLARLKGPVDAFFDGVMVMCDNERLRANRLALLSRLRALFVRIADVARLGRA